MADLSRRLLSRPHEIPRLFPVFPTEALVFIKPSQVYKQAYVQLLNEYCGTVCSLPCACQLYLTVLRLCLFCDYHNCGSIAEEKHNFPDFSRLSTWVSILPVYCQMLATHGCYFTESRALVNSSVLLYEVLQVFESRLEHYVPV